MEGKHGREAETSLSITVIIVTLKHEMEGQNQRKRQERQQLGEHYSCYSSAFICACVEGFPFILVVLLVRCSVILFSKPKLQKDLCFGKQEWFCEWSALSQERLSMEASQYGCSQMVGQ